MNIWSRILLHLRRARLRSSFMKEKQLLQDAFRSELLANPSNQGCCWHDIEWLTEPIFHVVPDTEEIPVALVGMAAVYSVREDESSDKPAPVTQAGTVLFYFQENTWQSNGRVLLNLTPAEALHQLDLKATSRAPV